METQITDGFIGGYSSDGGGVVTVLEKNFIGGGGLFVSPTGEFGFVVNVKVMPSHKNRCPNRYSHLEGR